MWAEPAVVKKANRLGRHQGSIGLGRVGIRVGQEVGAQHDEIEGDDDKGSHHGHAVFAEAPPHQLHLTGDEDPFLAVGNWVFFGHGSPVMRGTRGLVGTGAPARATDFWLLNHFKTDARVDPHQQQVRQKCADDGQGAEHHDDCPCQEHVLGDKGAQEQRAERGQP